MPVSSAAGQDISSWRYCRMIGVNQRALYKPLGVIGSQRYRLWTSDADLENVVLRVFVATESQSLG